MPGQIREVAHPLRCRGEGRIRRADGGLAEVVQDGVTGFLVEPGNVAALRERLEHLLRDHQLAARMGANARALALERFTWRACADRCLAAYAELR